MVFLIPTLSNAEVDFGTPSTLLGFVDFVDEDSNMHLIDIEYSDEFAYPKYDVVRNFALQMDPEVLAIIAAGRQVSCNVSAVNAEILISSCYVYFTNFTNLPFSLAPRLTIPGIAREFGLGQYPCYPLRDIPTLTADWTRIPNEDCISN